MGGRKKKLKASVAATEATVASTRPQVLASTSTSSKYAKPTLVGLCGMTE